MTQHAPWAQAYAYFGEEWVEFTKTFAFSVQAKSEALELNMICQTSGN